MVKIGDVALKIAGRDAGNICVVVDLINDTYVVIEGNTRKKKCNISHLTFFGKNVDVKKNADRNVVIDALKKSGFEFDEIKKGTKKEKKPQEKKRVAKFTEKAIKKTTDKK